MDNIKNIVAGGIMTLVIGGTAYTFSQEAVVNNMADDTGLTQEQAKQYINDIPEEDLASWNVIGSDHLTGSVETLALANDIDCENYEYEWESDTLTCSDGKLQLEKIGRTEELLGQAYIKLDTDTASKEDISTVIRYLDHLNSDYDQGISVIL